MDNETSSTQQFNMSLATLERIDKRLQWLSKYTILKKTHLQEPILRELYKELFPFLSEAERNEAKKNFIVKLDSTPIKQDVYDDQTYHYKKGLLPVIDNFDFWIRDKLHQKGLLMAKSDDPSLALGR